MNRIEEALRLVVGIGILVLTVSAEGASITSLTRVQYHADGLVKAVEIAPDSYLSSDYDGNGLLWRQRIGGVVVETTTYDEFGREISSTNARGATTYKTYTRYDQLETMTDGAGRIFRFSYDGHGQLMSELNPATVGAALTRNANGDVERTNYSNGDVSHTTFDSLGRADRAYDDKNTYSYDLSYGTTGLELNRIVRNTYQTNGRSGYEEFDYNSFNRQLTHKQSVFNGHTLQSSYEYDAIDGLTRTTYPSGTIVDYDREGGTHVKSISIDGRTVLSNIIYNSNGALQSYDYGNNTFALGYDTTGQHVANINSHVMNVNYVYDNQGLLTDSIDNNFAYATLSYQYYDDQTLRTQSEGENNSTLTEFQLDYRISNRNRERVTAADGGVFETYLLSDSVQRLGSVDGVSVSHDSRGNLISDRYHSDVGVASLGTVTRTFDGRNRIATSRGASSVNYFFNSANQRVAKQVDGVFHYYHYNEDGRILAESANGSISKEYIYLDTLLVAIKVNNAVYFVHNDRQKRPQLVTNEAGTIVWHATNRAFDRVVVLDNIDGMNIGYPGQYYDTETNTWDNGVRVYDSETGRYLQSDPLGLVDGPNTYLYAGNNPNRSTDSSGLSMKHDVILNSMERRVNAGDLTREEVNRIHEGRGQMALVSMVMLSPVDEGSLVVGAIGYTGKQIFSRLMSLSRAGSVTKSVRHGPTNPGPLADDVAATFRGGSYTATTTSETTTLYRVYGGSAGKLGPYWTRTKPSGPLQSQLDSALNPQWGNTANNVVSIKVPKGTQIFEGAAAPQPTGVGQILGGGNQVYIPRVNPKWIQ
ncbi:MAG: RHS repeat-associated core domain-containing protein [Pseudomonadales bacterium]|jgi:RHS repeat-associated protein